MMARGQSSNTVHAAALTVVARVGAGEVSELLVASPRGSAALTLAITPAPRFSLLGVRTSVNG
jgi:hypothetical protein